jgi:pimeloyl-ACP methyl ester carboxylesterase
VAGHSMGGMSILSCFAERPDVARKCITGAVLVNTTGTDVIAGSALGASVATVAAGVSAVAPRVVGAGVVNRSSDLNSLCIRALALTRNASPAHVAFTEQLVVACPSRVQAALMPTRTTLDLSEVAPEVTVPVLILAGERDRLTPAPQSERLLEYLRRRRDGDREGAVDDPSTQARLVTLPGVGHMAPLEAHETVTAHLRAFARQRLAVRDGAPGTP